MVAGDEPRSMKTQTTVSKLDRAAARIAAVLEIPRSSVREVAMRHLEEMTRSQPDAAAALVTYPTRSDARRVALRILRRAGGNVITLRFRDASGGVFEEDFQATELPLASRRQAFPGCHCRELFRRYGS